MDGNDIARQVELRAEATEAIVRSSSRKRLVVAGPGTGKTYTFRAALEATGGHGLALTFIRSLVRDLEVSLGDLADVFTFHAFCKWLIHQAGGSAGLSANFHMYPELPVLMAGDLACLGYPPVDPKEIVRRLHNLDTAEGIVDAVLERGCFYDAAGFEDAVLRVLRHLTDNPSAVPTYPLIVVDEYQDFSLLETAFIASLGAKNPVLIAGDGGVLRLL
ncbi:MAG TPA: UvrD-helicase domain-containing protein [Candidatus Limnocylindrales bacterium]|jgi:superfamily I DNA/RNA helicase